MEGAQVYVGPAVDLPGRVVHHAGLLTDAFYQHPGVRSEPPLKPYARRHG